SISGYAYDPDKLGKAITVDIYIDGNKVNSQSANDNNPAGAQGNHGFNFNIPAPYNTPDGSTHVVTVNANNANNTPGADTTLGPKSYACVVPPLPTATNFQAIFPTYLGERPPLY